MRLRCVPCPSCPSLLTLLDPVHAPPSPAALAAGASRGGTPSSAASADVPLARANANGSGTATPTGARSDGGNLLLECVSCARQVCGLHLSCSFYLRKDADVRPRSRRTGTRRTSARAWGSRVPGAVRCARATSSPSAFLYVVHFLHAARRLNYGVYTVYQARL